MSQDLEAVNAWDEYLWWDCPDLDKINGRTFVQFVGLSLSSRIDRQIRHRSGLIEQVECIVAMLAEQSVRDVVDDYGGEEVWAAEATRQWLRMGLGRAIDAGIKRSVES